VKVHKEFRTPKSFLFLSALLLLAGATRAGAQTKAYVAHAGADLVSVIDTGTTSVAGTIGGTDPLKIAIARDGTRAYITNTAVDSISVVDTRSDTIVATISTGDQPSSIAVSPDGARLYVMTAGGQVQVIDAARGTVTATIAAGTGGGGIAVTPDGGRVYVADGLVFVIDTATNTVVRSFAPERAAVSGISNNASSVAVAPDGRRVYVGVYTFDTTPPSGFTAYGSVVVVDASSESIVNTINLGSLPASIAFTPDGSRAYVGIQSTFVNTGYGMGFLPGRMVYVVDTGMESLAAFIDVGGTPSGIAVTPDRGSVYVVVPTLSAISVLDVNTNAERSRIGLAASPGDVAIIPDPGAAIVPYVVTAGADNGTVSTAGGTAVLDVLVNDTLGGIVATVERVTVTQVSSSSDGIAIDPATGAVNVARGTGVGMYSLVYRICETRSPANCADGEVTVTVRSPFVIDAVDDSGSTTPGWTAVANVLANDTLNGVAATTATVRLSLVSTTSPSISLGANGSVNAASGTAAGSHTLRYRICEIASPTNCDEADVAVTVIPFLVDAVDDSGSAPRSGGTAVVNVLANDKFTNRTATFGDVRLSQLSSGDPGISLNTSTGAVAVAAGTPVGSYLLAYRICEIAAPANCDDATVAVTVRPLQIIAANDVANGSSKVPNTALASVLSNDFLGGVRATPSNVRLSFVSLTPANNMIRLDLSDGSVDVLGKTSSITYALVYEICEIAMPSNCARATVTVNLSGGR